MPPRAAASRIALVIGNAEYQHAPILANPMNDAAGVAAAFKRLGFETELHCNLGLMELRRAFAKFSEASENAEMAVVYFAGHGVEIAGVNYLVPVDAKPATVGQVRWETMPLDVVLSVVDGAEQLRLIILDACRDNPFVGRMRGLEATRSLGRGLGSIEPHGNMLVAYAARHGTRANDGPLGGNSPFAEALVQHIESPNLEIRLLFGKVRDTVLDKTNGNQEPHLYGALGGEPIYLKRVITDPGRSAATDADAHEAMQALRDHRLLESKDIALVDAWLRTYGLKAPEFQREVVRKHRDGLLVTENADWQDADGRDDAAAYQEFLGVWPTGPHAADAKRRLVAVLGQKKAADAWAAVCESESLAALDAFLVDFADSEFGPAAKARRQDLAHRLEWHEVLSRSDDIGRLERFIKESPGPFTAAAQARLDALREAASKRQAQAPDKPPQVPPPPIDSAAERKRREARAHAKWSTGPTIDTLGSFERTIDTFDQYRLYLAFGVLACLASGGFLAPFWIGLWWIIGVCAIAAVFWIIDRRSRRATAATAKVLSRSDEPFTAAAQARLDELRAAAGRRGADESQQRDVAAPSQSWWERNVGGWDRFFIYIAFYLLACLAIAMPFWAGLLWVIGVCAVAVAFWVHDRRSRRASAATATATQVEPPDGPMPQAASTNIAPQRKASRYLPLTIAAAALAGSVICGMLQSSLFTVALATVFMFVRALLLAASVALAAWLHERNFRYAAWVFGIVAAGYLVGQQIYIATVAPNLPLFSSFGYPTFYIILGTIFMTIPWLPLLILAVWRFRALPSIWILACLVVAGPLLGLAMLGLAIPNFQPVRLVQNFIVPWSPWYPWTLWIPWTLWGACIGSILSRRKVAI